MRWTATIASLLLLAARASAYVGSPVYVTNQVGTTPANPAFVSIASGSVNVNIAGSLPIYVSSSAFLTVSFSVAVSSGSGYTVFNATGSLNQCSIIAPAPGFNFHLLTEGPDQFFVLGRDGISDANVGLYALRYLMGSYRAQVSGAASDGTYKVRCTLKL